MLGNLVIAHRFGRQILAEAGLFEAAVWCFRGERNVVVDPNRAEFEIGR